MTKQKLTQKQVDDLLKLVPNTNLDNIEIIKVIEPDMSRDEDDFFGDTDWEEQMRIERIKEYPTRKAQEELDRKMEEAAEASMFFGGYVKKTITRYEEEWDGEGGEYRTETIWVKANTRAQISNTHSSQVHNRR